MSENLKCLREVRQMIRLLGYDLYDQSLFDVTRDYSMKNLNDLKLMKLQRWRIVGFFE